MVAGTFICFDYQGNVLMNNAEEEKRSAESKVETRHLGMIMVLSTPPIPSCFLHSILGKA